VPNHNELASSFAPPFFLEFAKEFTFM